MSKEEEEDPQREEKVNLLLERTRLLRRDGEQPKSPKSMLPRPIRKEESDEQPLSARTQVICRENETLHADDELTLSDSSETNLEKTQGKQNSVMKKRNLKISFIIQNFFFQSDLNSLEIRGTRVFEGADKKFNIFFFLFF